MAKKSRSNSTTPAADSAPANNPFGALAALRGSLPAGQPGEAEAETTPAAGGSNKITLSRERKGRGGKTVTLIRGLELPADALDAMSRELRQALGTGGSIEDGAIVLNGEQAARAAEWLRQRGYARLVIGN